MGSAFTVLGLAFVSASFLGFAIAYSGFCTLSAVTDWVGFGDRGRLGSWLLAMGLAVMAVSVLEASGRTVPNEAVIPYTTEAFSALRYLLGGLIFGIGMHLSSGCSSKSLVRLGGGSMKALATVLAAAVVSYLLLNTKLYEFLLHPLVAASNLDLRDIGLADQRLTTLMAKVFMLETEVGTLWVPILLGSSVSVYSLTLTAKSARKHLKIGGIAVATAVVAGWWITGGSIGQRWIEDMSFHWQPPRSVGPQSFTFINPLADAVAIVVEAERWRWVTFALCGALGVVCGSCIYHLTTRRWRWETFTSLAEFRRCVLGGALLGLGGVLAMGCTIGQGVTGISTLAIGSILATAATCLGAAIAMKVEYYRLVYEESASVGAILLSVFADLHLLPNACRRLDRP